MKTPEQIAADIERRLNNTWNDHLDTSSEPAWPHTFPLGTPPPKADLEQRFEAYQQLALTLRSWASSNDVALTAATRLVHGTSQPIPTHVTVDSIDVAARLCGQTWTARLVRGRARLAELQARNFAGNLTRIVREVDTYSDLDFSLLCSTTEWFRIHGDEARGLTPRQVPVPGLQAKWLNYKGRQALIAGLAGLPGLELAPAHPSRIHFTYLDPSHLAGGGRRHDSASVGDAMTPAYTPRVVVITENKDAAVGFPPVPGGIAVEGDGMGAGTPASIGWLSECPTVIYWGDLDADGLTILNQYREAGLSVVSILMDIPTFDTYADFGTDYDVKGNPVRVSGRRELAKLEAHERALYERLTDHTWSGYRRIEQERIPLTTALTAVQAVVAVATPA